VAAVLIFCGAERALAQDGADGEAVYVQNCQSCHQPDGAGLPGTFPPLAGNPNAADGEYVRRVITNGLSGEIQVAGVTYNGVMPAVPLSDEELAAVVAHLANLAGTTAETTATTAAAGPVGGDTANGEALFSGATKLSAGGTACFACHSAGSLDGGGATLGPDLTDVFSRLGGEAGLSAWLAAPPSLTMQPIFSDRPLTEAEIADIVAFLAGETGTAPNGAATGALVGAGVGFAVLIGLVAMSHRGRRTYVEGLKAVDTKRRGVHAMSTGRHSEDRT
jgi:mono/diheme cytochrome c family protein